MPPNEVNERVVPNFHSGLGCRENKMNTQKQRLQAHQARDFCKKAVFYGRDVNKYIDYYVNCRCSQHNVVVCK